MSTFRNKTLSEKLGYLPTLVYFFRGHVIPYIHDLSRESISHWILHQAQRNRVYEWHDVDDLRESICRKP